MRKAALVAIAALLDGMSLFGQWTCDMTGPGTARPGDSVSVNFMATTSSGGQMDQSIEFQALEGYQLVSFTGVSADTPGLVPRPDKYSPAVKGTVTLTANQKETATATLQIDPKATPGSKITLLGLKKVNGKEVCDKQILILVQVAQGPKLQLRKDATPSTLNASGIDVIYTLTVSNIGNGPTTEYILLKDHLNADFTDTQVVDVFNESDGCKYGTINGENFGIECWVQETIPPGTAAAPRTFTVHYHTPVARVISNVAFTFGGGDSGAESNVTEVIATAAPRTNVPLSNAATATAIGRKQP